MSYDKGQTSIDRKQDLAGRDGQGKGQKNGLLPKSGILTDVAINYILELHIDALVFNFFVAALLQNLSRRTRCNHFSVVV